MTWYQNAGIKVDTDQDWGSCLNQNYSGNGNYFSYNISDNRLSSWLKGDFSHVVNDEMTIFHGTGLNDKTIKKNIADLGGNAWEWTAEIYAGYCIDRGGGAYDEKPVSYRHYNNRNRKLYSYSFRVMLYIQ